MTYPFRCAERAAAPSTAAGMTGPDFRISLLPVQMRHGNSSAPARFTHQTRSCSVFYDDSTPHVYPIYGISISCLSQFVIAHFSTKMGKAERNVLPCFARAAASCGHRDTGSSSVNRDVPEQSAPAASAVPPSRKPHLSTPLCHHLRRLEISSDFMRIIVDFYEFFCPSQPLRSDAAGYPSASFSAQQIAFQLVSVGNTKFLINDRHVVLNRMGGQLHIGGDFLYCSNLWRPAWRY